MKIAVLGAHGKSGQAYVAAALEAGHEVRAGIRGASPFAAHHALTVLQCDATNQDEIESLVAHQDIVVSLLGHHRGSQHDIQAQAIKSIVQLHQTFTFQRVITLTGTGVRMPGDHVRLIDTIVTKILVFLDPHRMRDGAAHVALLQQSKLNFTVLRVFKLTDGRVHPFSLSLNGPAAIFTSRKTVATAINSLIATNNFSRQLPMICSVQTKH